MKLGDFGISKRVLSQSTALRTEVGTRAFSAPETTPDDYEETFQYTNAVDMWSLGCVIYNVLAHSLPYKNSHAKSLPFETQPLKDRVHEQGINLLECLLRVDPSTRWTAQKALKHPWLEASSEASFAVAEDAIGNASSVAHPEGPNESQDKRNRPDEQIDMPTSISSVEKTGPKPVDGTEPPVNQLVSQYSGPSEQNGRIHLSGDNADRRKTTSNVLVSPSTYGISDYFVDPGTETMKPRKAGYRRPKDVSRGSDEGVTIKTPTASPVMPTSYSISNDDGERVNIKIDIETGTVTLRRLPKSEEQVPEKMKLVTTLRDLRIQEGDPEEDKIARALELIRKGVNLETRIHGETALHLAVRTCYSKKASQFTQILHELLERGADVDAENDSGETVLHIAVLSSLPNDNQYEIEVVRQLLRYRANVNAKDLLSRTPLHYAAWLSCWEYIDVLLEAGARVNELDKDGGTALHWAVLSMDHGEIIARILILAGINMDVSDNVGRTALDKARYHESFGVVEAIEEAKAQRLRSHSKGRDARSGYRNR